jgi:uncharacterized repeat protein (TIGR01451 family)
VEHNRADGVPPGGQARGGGIHNENDLNLLSNSQVRHNRAEWFGAYGGGVSNENNSSGNATFTLNASSVSTNTAQGDPTNGFTFGGGIYNGGNGTADLLAGEVRNNLAAGGQFAGGGGVASNNILTVTSSLVISNAATAALGSFGGGIQTFGSAALITDTRIHTNAVTAGFGADGGGWHNNVAGAQLAYSDVRFNQAQQDGGGVYNLGNDVQINDSAICQNQAQRHGGGVYHSAPFMSIMGTTICLNQAGLGGVGDGGGVHNATGSGIQIMMSEVLTNTTVDNGGGVFSAGNFAAILDSTLGANQASAGGGAYNAAGNMDIIQSILRANQASAGGGAYNAANMNIDQSTVQSNTANSLGGGLYNAATANVSLSALVNNTATSDGGGAHNAAGGTLSSQNNTFSGNSAPTGGGLNVALGSSAYLTFTTVASNTAGGGINVSSGGTAEVYATLLAYNAGSNCLGGVTNNGFSMSSDASCSFAFNNINPLLQPLALNGGQTLNHALSPGSQALDKVPSAQCTASVDQRSVSRPQGTACDIGAFELEEADLEVSKSADPSPVIAGQTITYTVIVTNVSTSGFANNVVLTDTLLGGTTFGGVVSSGGFTLQSSSSSQAVFTLPSLAASSSVTLVFTATAPAGGPITNTATVASGNPDPFTNNNTFTVTTPVTPMANLVVSKSAAPTVVLAGQVVTYVMTVTNTGPSTATNVVITDVLQGNAISLTVVATSSVDSVVTDTTGVTFTVNTLSAGGSAVMTYTVVASATGLITNTATAGAAELDSNPANNTASTTVTVTTGTDVRVVKTTPITQALAGQPAFYSVVVLNLGPLPATNVVITDVIQGGATFGGVVATSGGATLSSSTSTAVTFTVSALPVGGLAVVVYSIIAPPTGTITNTVTVAATEFDPQPANNTATVTTPVVPVANLSISKAPSFPTAIASTITPSAQLTYTILVTNNGPSPAANVVVTDVLPAGLTFVSATGSGWSCSNSGQTVTCTVSSLSMGAAPAIQIVASAPVTPGLVLTNTAVVNAATFPNTPVTSNSVVVKVQFRAFLPIVRRP